MEIRNEVLKNKQSLINDLIGWVKIKSVLDKSSATKGAPFGKGVKESLDYIYNLAIKEGFKATNYDGYCVEIEYGKGDEIIGIFGHGDVVPEGENWKFDPYSGTIDNNLIYGRGSSDDKGPTICSFYALKILKDNGIIPSKTIRLVVGGNEENGSLCLEHYFKTLKKPNPTYGFTPDAEFPLIYGEKGIMTFKFKGNRASDVIESINAGVAVNAVPSTSIFKLKKDAKKEEIKKSANKYKMDAEFIDSKTIKFIGKAAHASTPELGINALTYGFKVISEVYNDEFATSLFNMFYSYYGEGLKINHNSTTMGLLTVNLGLGKYIDNNY